MLILFLKQHIARDVNGILNLKKAVATGNA